MAVRLAARPAANVTVNVARVPGDPDLTAGPPALTFTPANWSTPQVVTVSAAQDADRLNGYAEFTLSASGLAVKTFDATEADDDTAVPPPPPPPPATAKTLRAAADATVRDGSYANQNFGSAADLWVKNVGTGAAGYNRVAALRFDLTGVSTINAGNLRLWTRVDRATGPAVTVGVYGSTNVAWIEAGVTWANQPAAGPTALRSFAVAGTTGKWHELDLTAYLKAELAAGRRLITLVLKAPAAVDQAAVFASDEAVANRPEPVVR